MIKEKLIPLHKEHCNSVEQKMLYNLTVLLTELYEKLDKIESPKEEVAITIEKEKPKIEVKNNKSKKNTKK